MSEPVLNRIGRVCDGWSIQRTFYTELSPEDADAHFAERLEAVHSAARSVERDPSEIDLGAAIDVVGNTLEQQVTLARQWEARGATHLALAHHPRRHGGARPAPRGAARLPRRVPRGVGAGSSRRSRVYHPRPDAAGR